MIKDLQVTMYEFFGYFLPGVVCLAALTILHWTIFYPKLPLPLIRPPSIIWVPSLFVAYVLGHVVQGVTNDLPVLCRKMAAIPRRLFRRGKTEVTKRPPKQPGIPAELLEAARKRLAVAYGTDPAKIDDKELCSCCRHAVAWCGGASANEIFVYREGFYRGMSLGLVACATALIWRVCEGPALIRLEGTLISVPTRDLLALTVATLLASVVIWRRRRRFASYRDYQAVLAFVMCATGSKDGCK